MCKLPGTIQPTFNTSIILMDYVHLKWTQCVLLCHTQLKYLGSLYLLLIINSNHRFKLISRNCFYLTLFTIQHFLVWINYWLFNWFLYNYWLITFSKKHFGCPGSLPETDFDVLAVLKFHYSIIIFYNVWYLVN